MNNEIIKAFRRVYSESEASILEITDTGTPQKVISAKFADGIFHFIVGESTVSPSYDTKDEALKNI